MTAGLHAPAALVALCGAAGVAGAGCLAMGRARVVGCLFAALSLGALLGATTGATHRAACTAELRTGDPVVASGTVAGRVGAAGRGRIRVRLRDVTLSASEGHCRLPGLLARVSAPGRPPGPGTRVRVEGEWLRFESTGRWLPAPGRRGMLTGGALETTDVARGPWLLRLRARTAERLAARLAPDVAPTALALILAERDDIEPALRRRFVDAGLAHLLAISGMHVGLLAAGAVWLLGLGLGVRRRVSVALALVTCYVLLIGAPPAARRALAVFGGYAWARHRAWPSRPGELLGGALLAVVVAAPGSVLEPGLQLSFAGVAGVILGERAGSTLRVRRRGWRKLAGAAGAGAGAVLTTTPLTAFHFGQAAPVSLVSHFAGAPLVAVGLGSLAATIALPGWLVGPAADLATGTLRTLHAVAELFARLPGGHRTVAAPPVALWIAWVLALEAVRRVAARGGPRAGLGPALLAVVAVVGGPLASGMTSGTALLCTLSVGQGDAAVLRTSAGRWLVFDGGPAWGEWNAGRSIVLPFLRRHGARRVELGILSHPDLDHLGGLRGLLPEIHVERVLDTGDPVPSAAYAGFLAEVDAEGVQWLPAGAGDRLRVDDAVVTVLGPVARQGAAGEPAKGGEVNATSLSFRLTVGGRFRYLNTGDATVAEEQALLAAWPTDSLRADLLKVGHHGSRTSSDPAFLKAVAPRIAVVSAGAGNRYGHPHPEVLGRLEVSGVERVWRTDRHGTLCVEVAPDGRWRVRGEGPWRNPGA
ncbi:MAG TPA: ComEC/Rec2 family competence protein [Gemmatimonadota bacterium]|nr:ComEC/Rec2 family competence protein [Gemmatimonadota bacterium]